MSRSDCTQKIQPSGHHATLNVYPLHKTSRSDYWSDDGHRPQDIHRCQKYTIFLIEMDQNQCNLLCNQNNNENADANQNGS